MGIGTIAAIFLYLFRKQERRTTMNNHIITYRLSKDTRKDLAMFVRPSKPWVHIKTWVAGAFSLLVAYLSYRLILLLIVAMDTIKTYESIYETVRPFFRLASESLSTLTSSLLTIFTAFLLIYFIFRFIFFYVVWVMNERALKYPSKEIANQETIMAVDVDPENYHFNLTVQHPGKRTSIQVTYVEQDIVYTVPFKDGYILILSFAPFVKETLLKTRKPLTKNKKIFTAAIRFNLFLQHRILNHTGLFVYFPLNESFNYQEQDFLKKRLNQYLKEKRQLV